jgi:hypothetical protein
MADESTDLPPPDPTLSTDADHSTYEPLDYGAETPIPEPGPQVVQTLGYPPPPEPVVLAGLAPASIVAGVGPVPVTVTGSGFTPAATVWADEESQTTTVVSGTELGYNAQADQAGSQTITVRDGATVSNSVELTVSASRSRSKEAS